MPATPNTSNASSTADRVLAYGYALYPMLVGIILTAAGLQTVIAESNHPVPLAAALTLSGGVALFLFGQCCFRWALGLPRSARSLQAKVSGWVTS